MESNIRNLREERNITQKTLGEVIGVSQQIVSRMEKNRNTIQADVLIQLADYFGVSTDIVLGYQGKDKGISSVMDILQMQMDAWGENIAVAEQIGNINAKNRMLLYQIALLMLRYQ